MTELEAWRDADMSEVERRMLAAARADRIPNELKLRMAGALATTAVGASLASASTASASASTASASTAGASTSAKATGLLFSKAGLWGWVPLAMLAATGVWHVTQPAVQSDARTPAPLVSQARAQLRPSADTLAPASGPAPGAVAAAPAATPLPAQPVIEPVAAAPAAGPAAAGVEGDLRAEVALLDRARAALASGANQRASRLLAQHRQRFPHGTLDPEAEALRIETLVRLGAPARAQQLGQRFLERYPSHPLRDHVIQLLAR